MKPSIDELEAIVRHRICGVCTERTVEGECGREEPSSCSLFRLFPEVAQAIESVSSNDIRRYIDAIRGKVCTVCTDQAPDGTCQERQQVTCSLDAYLPLIVDAIEEATGRSFDRNLIPIMPAGPAVGPGPQIRL
ncbi:MAG: hypothetical protein ABI759_06880 [Candidatus Solibacter sp.]